MPKGALFPSPQTPSIGQEHTDISSSVQETQLDFTTENIFKSPSVVMEGGFMSSLWRQANYIQIPSLLIMSLWP